MKWFAFAILGILIVLIVASGVQNLADTFSGPTSAALAADYARAERIRQDAELSAVWAPLNALALSLFTYAVLGGAAAYLGALGAVHVRRSWHERRPDGRGLLPVEASDQGTARAALAGFHAAQIETARRPLVQTVPTTLTYSPSYAPQLEIEQHGCPEGATAAAAAAPVIAGQLPGLTDLASLGFRPSLESILLALGDAGEPITVPARALCHVALVGATGGGKSNLLRLLLPQLLAVGARVVLADPHFAPLDPESGEDWRPIAGRLHMAPAVSPAAIESLLGYLVDELDRRMAQRRAGERWGPPLFIAFDELPVIADQVPGALEQLGRLLREGRKVDLLAIGASQTMLVKVIGGDSSIRDAYRTAFYLGGDARSGAALLDLPQRDIDEGLLATGVAYLRSRATLPARLVRVPYASNTGVAGLLEGLGGMPDGSLVEAAPVEGSRSLIRPEAARALALFRQGLDLPQIVKELRGIESSAGRRYQDAARAVQQLLREALA